MLPIALRACLLRVQLRLFWYIFFSRFYCFINRWAKKRTLKQFQHFLVWKWTAIKISSYFPIVIGILLLQHLRCCFSNQFTNKTFHDTNVWFRTILLPANYQYSNHFIDGFMLLFFCTLNLILIYLHWKQIFQEKKVCFFFSLFNVNQNKMYNKFFRYSFCSLIFKQTRFNKMNSLYFCWGKKQVEHFNEKKNNRTLLFYMAIYCYLNDFCVQSCLHHKSIVVKNISNIFF